MQSTNWTDKAIIEAICGDTASRNAALKHVYIKLGWRQIAIVHITKNGGNEQDAEEAANDAFVDWDKNIRMNKFKGNSSLKTYFVSIAYNQWLKNIRGPKISFDELDVQKHERPDSNVDDNIMSERKRDYLEKATDIFGEKCKKILRLKQLNYSSEKMAVELGLKNANMAKKAWYRCKEKFRKYFKEHPQWKEF